MTGPLRSATHPTYLSVLLLPQPIHLPCIGTCPIVSPVSPYNSDLLSLRQLLDELAVVEVHNILLLACLILFPCQSSLSWINTSTVEPSTIY